MEYIDHNGKKVSTIGIGCMRIAQLDQNQASEFIHEALGNGINFFDHADIYGKGECERIFGEVLREEPELRNQMFLQSKCAIHDWMYDFSKEYILESVEGILTRLHTDHLDSLLLHRPDVLMEPEEVNEAFRTLKKQGKVLSFGVSNMNRFQMELLSSRLEEPLWADQLQLSLAHTPLIDEGINVNMHNEASVVRSSGTLEYLLQNDMTLQVWSPLQKGFFQGIFLNDPEYQELNDLLEQLGEKYHGGKDAIAYAWLLRLPQKVQVILGTAKKQRLAGAAKAADIHLTRKEWYDLYKAVGNKLP